MFYFYNKIETKYDRAQEETVLDNSLKFLNHQITLNLELCNSSYDQNNMTVKSNNPNPRTATYEP